MDQKCGSMKSDYEALKTKVDKLKKDQGGQRVNGADVSGHEGGQHHEIGGLHAKFDKQYVSLKFNEWQPKM